jgi:hypothetical protein
VNCGATGYKTEGQAACAPKTRTFSVTHHWCAPIPGWRRRTVGDVGFGAAAEFNGNAATLDWYDYLFKRVQNEFAQKPVNILVMGLNQWRQEDDWPLDL